uniref:Uncharacterized protein n=1 Tax=Anguilla anguilla TaxID=7936 RepID=A0A0E9VLH8_ANGAN
MNKLQLKKNYTDTVNISEVTIYSCQLNPALSSACLLSVHINTSCSNIGLYSSIVL